MTQPEQAKPQDWGEPWYVERAIGGLYWGVRDNDVEGEFGEDRFLIEVGKDDKRYLDRIVAYLNGEDQDAHTIAEAAIDFEVSKAAIEQALWREGYRVQTRWVKLPAGDAG